MSIDFQSFAPQSRFGIGGGAVLQSYFKDEVQCNCTIDLCLISNFAQKLKLLPSNKNLTTISPRFSPRGLIINSYICQGGLLEERGLIKMFYSLRMGLIRAAIVLRALNLF